MAVEARKLVIHSSLIRPILIGGAERTPVFLLVVIVAALIFGVANLYSVLFGIILAFVGMWGLKNMAKKDPQLSAIYKRHIHYHDYYPARAKYTSKLAYVHKK